MIDCKADCEVYMSDDIVIIDHEPKKKNWHRYYGAMVGAGLDPDAPIPIEAMKEPIWEFQPECGEIDDAYKQFLLYALVPAGGRNLRRAWDFRGRGRTDEKTEISRTLSAHANRYQWQRRASEWDFHKLKTVQTDWITREEKRRE